MKLFSTREAAEILEVPEARVRWCVRSGAVHPRRDDGGQLRFTFQDLLLLKTTKGLLDSGVPARRVRRIWSSLRRQLADDLPLTSVKIYADGERVVAWDGSARWQPDSGQFLLELDAGALAARAGGPEPVALRVAGEEPRVVTRRAVGETHDATHGMPSAGTRAPRPLSLVEPATGCPPETSVAAEDPSLTADEWFHLGCELESSAPAEARQAYHAALAIDDTFADAHINLGRQYHEIGELGKAEAHYRAAVAHAPEDPAAHFNLGVLLEDRDRADEAIHAYRQAIARDDELADAHYNLGLLLDRMKRRSEAMSHLMIARKLYAGSKDES